MLFLPCLFCATLYSQLGHWSWAKKNAVFFYVISSWPCLHDLQNDHSFIHFLQGYVNADVMICKIILVSFFFLQGYGSTYVIARISNGDR